MEKFTIYNSAPLKTINKNMLNLVAATTITFYFCASFLLLTNNGPLGCKNFINKSCSKKYEQSTEKVSCTRNAKKILVGVFLSVFLG